jgi:hypothetical protein
MKVSDEPQLVFAELHVQQLSSLFLYRLSLKHEFEFFNLCPRSNITFLLEYHVPLFQSSPSR